MAKTNIEGLDKLQKALKDGVSLDLVKRVVQKHGDQLNKRMKAQTKIAFVKGYSKGDLASNINNTYLNGGFTVEVGTTADYGEYVEYGTRKMEAEPFCAPAFNVQKEKFKIDMQKLVK